MKGFFTAPLADESTTGNLSHETLRQMAAKWLPSYQVPRRFHVQTDATDFFRVDYDDVLLLEGRPYLVRHSAKELRFDLEDEEKFWVKRAIDLADGRLKIIKFVFFERFMAHIGEIEFECFRSPRKEARIPNLVSNHGHFMHGSPTEDENGNTIRVIDFIKGKPLHAHVNSMEMDHKRYFHEQFPHLLDHFKECVRAIGFLHDHGERHGDIRRDHITYYH